MDNYFGNLSDPTLLIVDDEEVNRKLLQMVLEANGYSHILTLDDATKVVETYKNAKPDLILLDLNMPDMDGIEVLGNLKALHDPLLPPVIMLTAQQGREYVLKALEAGARDYVTKPFDVAELLARVRSMLEVHQAHKILQKEREILEEMVRIRTKELFNSRLQIIQRLGRASEFRDNETGMHTVRVSRSAAMIARELGWDETSVEDMLNAAPMHDIGKIGIPDAILLKPGKLNGQEWEIMKNHTAIGARILEGDQSTLLGLAEEIAMSHHERWDGGGYPEGLSSADVPVSGAIVSVADVFDALLSQRPYKEPWTIDQAVDYIRQNREKHFSPDVVDAFLVVLDRILEMRSDLTD